jgi:type VI secretion system protein ImpM
MPQATGGSAGTVGFFGKLSGAGDFVQRRLPPAFVEHWDRHFEQAVAASREQLGERWHEVWHASPAWRFVLAPGVCTESAWAGLMVPAADRVGRCFPMVMAAPLDADSGELDPFARVLRDGERWFNALEHLFVQAQFHGAGVDAFDAQLSTLPSPLVMDRRDTLAVLRGTDWRTAPQWRLPLPAQRQPGAFLHTLWSQVQAVAGTWCLWWTHGAGNVPASVLLTQGLPQPASYASFLDAHQASAGWASLAGFQAPPPAAGQRHDAPLHSPHAPATPVEEAPIAASMVASSVEPLPRLPDDLSEMLDGVGTSAAPIPAALIPDDVTVPGFGRHAPISAVKPPAADTASPSPQRGTVYRSADGALALLAADDGAHDPRCRGAVTARAVAAAMAPRDFSGGMQNLRERLLARHPLLQLSGEDLIDPVMEDAAVVALHTTGRWAALLRIGTGEVWQWRRGQLRPVFAVDSQQGGDVDDLLHSRSSPIAAGLGAPGAPRSDEIVCAVERGDRFLLLATRRMAGLEQRLLAQALALPACDDARAFLAHAAALGTDPDPWPLAVIEITP